MKQKPWLLLSSLVILMCTSCSNAEFTGKNKESPKGPPGGGEVVPIKKSSEVIKLSCDEMKSGNLKKDLSLKANTDLELQGEICYQGQSETPTASLSVSFLVDVSGSMFSNDAIVDGTCGRYKAVENMIEKLKNELDSSITADISVVLFGDYATVVESNLSLDSLSLDPLQICDAKGATNYEDALVKTRTLFNKDDGRKAVYLISDGMPTMGIYGPVEAPKRGIDAAKNLREEFNNLSLYSIYLENSVKDETPAGYSDPAAYLAALTADASKVKIVDDVEKLAESLAQFELPDPEKITISQPTIKLIDETNISKSIEIESFTEIFSEKWRFNSKSFTPVLIEAEKGVNKIEIEVKASDGIIKKLNLELNITIVK